MLNYEDLDADQRDLVERLYNYNTTLVYATMGSGKTVCYLSAIDELMVDEVFKRALIVAPLRPANEVWAHEHKQWHHLENLHVAMATGDAKKRNAAIASDANVVVINIENLVWFFNEHGKTHNFDMLCIDELSKFGDNSSKVVKALRKYTNTFKHRVGLTGSPVHESMVRLFSQVAVLDGGKIFGRNKQKFLEKYFVAIDYEQRNWELRMNMKEKFFNALNPILHAMPDYTHKLPPVNEISVFFNLTDKSMRDYNKFARESVLQIGKQITYDEDGMMVDDENIVVAENAAVLSGKLEQLTSGFVYDGDDCITLSSERLNAFINLRTQILNDRCLIFYTFEYERQEIGKALIGNYTTLKDTDAVEQWNAGKIDNLLMHPKSAGHGLNLAKGGHTIICYSPIWSNDMFKQLIARLWRRGQTQPVTVYILRCHDTVDDIKSLRISDKEENDRLLREHIKSRQ